MNAISSMLVPVFLAFGLPAQDPKPAPLFDEKAEARAQIAEALSLAGRENRRVLVEWGANWCRWCRMLQELFTTDPKVKREILYEYEIVRIDVGRFDKNLDLATQYGIDFARGIGIPYLTILDAEGKVLASQETASLEFKEHGRDGHDPAKVFEFLARHQAPYPEAEALFAGALAAAKAQEKLLFLHFCAPGSAPSRKLEVWTASAEIAPLLQKDFVNSKIDVERTIGGKERMYSLRKDDAKTLPWFAILDAEGTALATSEAPAGEAEPPKNIQFPLDAAGIAHFKSMLEKVARRITAADIESLVRSLDELRELEEKQKAKKGED